MSETLDMDAEGLPEEPVRDWWLFEDDSKGVVLIAAAGLVAVGGTLGLLYAALTSEA